MLKTLDGKSIPIEILSEEGKPAKITEWRRRKIWPPVLTVIVIAVIFIFSCFQNDKTNVLRIFLSVGWLTLILSVVSGMILVITIVSELCLKNQTAAPNKRFEQTGNQVDL